MNKTPYFPGKLLAQEAKERGLKAVGPSDDIQGMMLIGLIQILDELKREIEQLKEKAK